MPEVDMAYKWVLLKMSTLTYAVTLRFALNSSCVIHNTDADTTLNETGLKYRLSFFGGATLSRPVRKIAAEMPA